MKLKADRNRKGIDISIKEITLRTLSMSARGKGKRVYNAITKHFCKTCKYRLLVITDTQCPHYEPKFAQGKRRKGKKTFRVYCRNNKKIEEVE